MPRAAWQTPRGLSDDTGAWDAQELLALQAGLIQPLAEKTAAYSRHLYDIASGTGAEFGKAFEGDTAEAQKDVCRSGGQRRQECSRRY